MTGRLFFLAIAVVAQAAAAQAQSDLTRAEISFMFGGASLSIAPASADAPTYAARFAALTPSCDPACIVPRDVAEAIETIAEPEVLAFLVEAVANSQGLLVDARLPEARAMGFIPGSVNLPHVSLQADNSFRDDILEALGARSFEGAFNFADAQPLVVFDNGPAQNDAGQLISHLRAAGYPPEKLRYYRGGMQVWSVVGLTVQE